MLSFGNPRRPQYGGVGVALRNPALELEFSARDHFAAVGPLADRIESFVERAAAAWELESVPPSAIRVATAPPSHVGLGVGTQLGIAVAAGMRCFLGLPQVSIDELARSVGRARRSSVGSYAFDRGGLILEEGQSDPTTIGRLLRRVEMPPAWRWVLITPDGQQGLSGTREAAAFRGLPPVDERVTEILTRLAQDEIMPAAAAGRFADFSRGVYEYGVHAGTCFATVQGGPFATRAAAELVAQLRAWGFAGVGQSSWGPTIFAATESEGAAARLVGRLREYRTRLQLSISASDNRGAETRRVS